MSSSRDKFSSSHRSFVLNLEVQSDNVAESANLFSKTCFEDESVDKDVHELLNVINTSVDAIVPNTNYIALNRDVQKLLKKCSEFPVVYEQYKKDREERLANTKQRIEEEKKQIDLEYRQKAQEMKREYERKMIELENEV